MTEKQFNKLLKELKSKKGNTDYYIDLWFRGTHVGCIYADGNLDNIEVDDRNEYVLVYTYEIGVFVDRAEVRSI